MSKIIETCKRAFKRLLSKFKNLFRGKKRHSSKAHKIDAHTNNEHCEHGTESSVEKTEDAETSKTTVKQRVAARCASVKERVAKRFSGLKSRVSDFFGKIRTLKFVRKVKSFCKNSLVAVSDFYTTWQQVIFDVGIVALGFGLGFAKVNFAISLLCALGYYFLHKTIVEKVYNHALNSRNDELVNIDEAKINKAIRDPEFRATWDELSEMSVVDQNDVLVDNTKTPKLFKFVNSDNYMLYKFSTALAGTCTIGAIGKFVLHAAPSSIAVACGSFMFAALTVGMMLPHVVNAIAGSRANKKASSIIKKIMNTIDAACARVDAAAKARRDARIEELKNAKYGTAPAL